MALAVQVADALCESFSPSPTAQALHAVRYGTRCASEGWRLPAGLTLLDFRGRLDNRAELGAALDLQREEALLLPADRLILLAYQRWGESLVSHLRGDWWFALWDGSRRRLLLARDTTGPTPLYYAHSGARLMFSPSINDLLQVPGVAKGVCEERLVAVLLVWIYGDHSRTEYEGVRQLLPGHRLSLDAGGLSVQAYWEPEALTPLCLPKDDDYVECFLDLYRQAVAHRTPPGRKTGSMLSAGLDSGSVTALAARELARRGERLPAFTHVPLAEVRSLPPPTHLIDEWPLAGATADMAGTVDHVAIHSDHLSPLRASLLSLEMTGLLQCTLPNAPWLHALHAEAQQRGLEILLNGQFGNIAVSWEGLAPSIWPLLGKGQWNSAGRTLRRNRPPTLRTLFRALGGQVWRALRPAPPLGPRRFAELPPSPIQPKLAAAWRRPLEAGVPAQPPRGPLAIRNFMLNMILTSTAANSGLAAAYGMEAADPTADQALVEFCLRIPAEQFSREEQGRWLMRRAMEDILPPEVRGNRRRGVQAADYSHRLLASRSEIDTVLALMDRSDLVHRYLDLPYLRRCWERLRPALAPTRETSDLNRGLGTGLLLTRIEGLELPL